MKRFTSLFFIIFFLLLINSSCKKDPDCGCNADAKYTLPKTAGELVYNQTNGKWMFTYSPGRGAFNNFFPCNLNQDSLKVILQGASQNQSFLIWLSGNVKSPCPDENFGNVASLTTFEYITVEYAGRN